VIADRVNTITLNDVSIADLDANVFVIRRTIVSLPKASRAESWRTVSHDPASIRLRSVRLQLPEERAPSSVRQEPLNGDEHV